MGNMWMEHVMRTKNQNPGLAFKDVLKLASKSYKKRGGGYMSDDFKKMRDGTDKWNNWRSKWG